MDKYGVEEDATDTKTAAESSGLCPSCGRKLTPLLETGVLLCPHCGSEPFEVKDDDAKNTR